MIALAVAAAGVYAASLLLVARSGARRRSLTLGGTPWSIAVLCACAAAATAAAAPLHAAAAFAGLSGAIVCAHVDVRTGYIFNELSAAIAGAGAVCALGDGTLPYALAGGTVNGGALLALYVLTRRRGIGFGDVKLAAALGMCFGITSGVLVLGAAFITGAAAGTVVVLRNGRRPGRSLPFAPFLAAGSAVAVIAGARLAVL